MARGNYHGSVFDNKTPCLAFVWMCVCVSLISRVHATRYNRAPTLAQGQHQKARTVLVEGGEIYLLILNGLRVGQFTRDLINCQIMNAHLIRQFVSSLPKCLRPEKCIKSCARYMQKYARKLAAASDQADRQTQSLGNQSSQSHRTSEYQSTWMTLFFICVRELVYVRIETRL